MHGMQVLVALAQQRRIFLLFTERFERRARLIELAGEFTRNDVQGLR